MPRPSKLQQKTIDYVAAYDERKRLFERLRDLRLDDAARQTAVEEYAAAAAKFDKLRSDIVSEKGA